MLARQTSLTFLSPFITTQRKILTKTCRGKVLKESRIQINNATNVLKK